MKTKAVELDMGDGSKLLVVEPKADHIDLFLKAMPALQRLMTSFQSFKSLGGGDTSDGLVAGFTAVNMLSRDDKDALIELMAYCTVFLDGETKTPATLEDIKDMGIMDFLTILMGFAEVVQGAFLAKPNNGSFTSGVKETTKMST
jgi:hypothetical protein